MKAERYYRIRFAVLPLRGKHATDFPLDMLRYDSAHPGSEPDANTIHACLGRFDDGVPVSQLIEMGGIRLTMISPHNRGPTRDRWLSFGWQVVKIDGKLTPEGHLISGLRDDWT